MKPHLWALPHVLSWCSMTWHKTTQQSGSTFRQKLLAWALDIGLGHDWKRQHQVYWFSQWHNCCRLYTKRINKTTRQETATRSSAGPVFHPLPNYAFPFLLPAFSREFHSWYSWLHLNTRIIPHPCTPFQRWEACVLHGAPALLKVSGSLWTQTPVTGQPSALSLLSTLCSQLNVDLGVAEK